MTRSLRAFRWVHRRSVRLAPVLAAWGIALLGVLLVSGCGDTGGCGGG